jgi:glycosyltransferase involved in cell wall biosynthesis
VQDGITGRLVHRPTSRALASAITRLLLDEPERAEMGRRALSWSQAFTWERTARSVWRAIAAATKNHVRRQLPTSHSPSPASAGAPAEVGVVP